MGFGWRVRRLWDGARRLPRGGVISVTAGFLLHLSLGIMYTYGNLTTYLTSYMHVRLGLDVDYGDTMWIGAVQSIAQGPGALLGSMLYNKLGPRLAILIGGSLCSCGMALTCLTVQKTYVATLMTYGVVSGLGIGLAYTSPLLAGYRWFPHNRGAVSGVIVGGYGLGSIILTSVQTSYLNPENVSPEDDGYFHDDELLDRVPSLFLVQAAICAGLQLCGVLGVHPPPQGLAPETLTEEMEETEVKSEQPAGDGVEGDDAPPKRKPGSQLAEEEDPKAWRRHLFTIPSLQLMLGFIMNAYGMGSINAFWKAFGQTFIKDDHFLAMAGVGSSVFNMLGRLVWGFVCDILGYKPTMLVLSGLLASLLFTFPSTSLVGQGMFLVWMWAIFFCMAGTFSVVVTGTATTFGTQHAGHIYGVIFLVSALCSPPVSLAAELMLDRWGFAPVFLLGGGLVCIGLVATFTVRSPRKNVEDNMSVPEVKVTAL